ncbi:hypothetical protein DPMN_070018 [Dreissena polymorpha]|uniref:Uncharacterized protein n=1 Tax=Dreissena polymorpha TaxID=45954 RepID=A0A9D3Z5E6_DREPO|nr:hypothetical protein DPMN_070018 [Dreissena polymorpha]
MQMSEPESVKHEQPPSVEEHLRIQRNWNHYHHEATNPLWSRDLDNHCNRLKKIQIIINTCLRKILKIRWPEKISNEELLRRTKQQLAEEDALQRHLR